MQAVADSCRGCRQLQRLQTASGVAEVTEKVATRALKPAVAENVKTVTGTNFIHESAIKLLWYFALFIWKELMAIILNGIIHPDWDIN